MSQSLELSAINYCNLLISAHHYAIPEINQTLSSTHHRTWLKISMFIPSVCYYLELAPVRLSDSLIWVNQTQNKYKPPIFWLIYGQQPKTCDFHETGEILILDGRGNMGRIVTSLIIH